MEINCKNDPTIKGYYIIDYSDIDKMTTFADGFKMVVTEIKLKRKYGKRKREILHINI